MCFHLLPGKRPGQIHGYLPTRDWLVTMERGAGVEPTTSELNTSVLYTELPTHVVTASPPRIRTVPPALGAGVLLLTPCLKRLLPSDGGEERI